MKERKERIKFRVKRDKSEINKTNVLNKFNIYCKTFINEQG